MPEATDPPQPAHRPDDLTGHPVVPVEPVEFALLLRPDGQHVWAPFPQAQRGGDVHVHVTGEADLCTAQQLLVELVRIVCCRPATVVVDLAGLSFCDFRGLEALQDALGLSEAAGVAMSWHAASPMLLWMHRAFPAKAQVLVSGPLERGVVAFPRQRVDPGLVPAARSLPGPPG